MYNTTTINCITFNGVEIGDSHFLSTYYLQEKGNILVMQSFILCIHILIVPYTGTHLLSSWRLSSHLFLSAGRQGIYQCCRGPRNQPRRTEVEICTEFKTPEHAKELYLIGHLRTGFVNAKVESSLDQCKTLAAVEGGCICKTKGKLSRSALCRWRCCIEWNEKIEKY